MFDPARTPDAYLPRTNPVGKSERLYSRRSSLRFDRLPLFIQFRSDRVARLAQKHTLPPLTLSAEQAQQRVVTDLHQSEPHRHAEHEGEGKVRYAVEL